MKHNQIFQVNGKMFKEKILYNISQRNNYKISNRQYLKMKIPQ